MNTKAQTQNLETIIVIFIITIILAIAIVVFYNFNTKSLDRLEQRYQQNLAYNLLATLPLQPELQYTEIGFDKNAIDKTKLLTSNPKLKGFMTIHLVQIYPDQPEKICTQENQEGCNTYILYDNQPTQILNQEKVSVPVSLYDSKTKEKAFAILEVTNYY